MKAGNGAKRNDRIEPAEESRRFTALRSGLSFSALGDGAAWIWNIVRSEFGNVRECLDIFHALEHVAACGKSLYGETEESVSWLDRMRLVLLSEGFDGMERELLKLRLKEPRCKAVDSLLRYLESHRERLNYCERLREGRVIGSGQVEGACKNMIGRRLKQTGAQWKVRRLNRMTILCAVRYSDHWKDYWKNAK